MNEQEIIKGCLRKDKKAWDLFIKKYSRLVYWAIGRRLQASNFRRNQSDIEDIFQEVFLKVLNDSKLFQLKDPKFIPGWLAMTASNMTVDFMRRQSRQEESLDLSIGIFKDDNFKQDIIGRDISLAIEEIISSLSDKERMIISLNLLQERTHREVAQIVGAPVNTVSTVIARTKEKLKKELQKREIADYF